MKQKCNEETFIKSFIRLAKDCLIRYILSIFGICAILGLFCAVEQEYIPYSMDGFIIIELIAAVVFIVFSLLDYSFKTNKNIRKETILRFSPIVSIIKTSTKFLVIFIAVLFAVIGFQYVYLEIDINYTIYDLLNDGLLIILAYLFARIVRDVYVSRKEKSHEQAK